MAKNRIDHIDIAKAIGIVLIISSHIVCTTNFSKDLLLTTYWNVLGSFYVPFFFLLSGIFTPLGSGNLLNKPSLIKLGRGILNLIFQFFIFFILGYSLALLIKSTRTASLVSSGIFMFLLFTSGVALPVESLPKIVQQVAHVFPMYHAIQVIQMLWINEFSWAENGANCLAMIFYSILAVVLLVKVRIKWD